jgi:hypothetical protein
MSDSPKSALELVMERLRRKDAEAGVEEQKLTDAQKAAIAEARSVHDAKVAERQILHRSTVAGVFDPQEREKLDEEYRRDRSIRLRSRREDPQDSRTDAAMTGCAV